MSTFQDSHRQFFLDRFKKKCSQILLNSFIIEIKVVRNVISNNIDIYDQPSRIHRSPPRSRQNFPDSKNSKIDKSETNISYLIIECFDQDESCQELYFKQLIYLHEKLPILHCSPSGSLQSWPNSQIWGFLNLTQLFSMTPYSQ